MQRNLQWINHTKKQNNPKSSAKNKEYHCGKNFVNYFKYWLMNLWTVHQIGKMSQNIDIGLRKKFRFIFAKIMPEV